MSTAGSRETFKNRQTLRAPLGPTGAAQVRCRPRVKCLGADGYVVFHCSFLVSVLYSKAKLASACGGIIYFLSYVPYMYVAIREEVAHDKITAFEKCIAVRFVAGQGEDRVRISSPPTDTHLSSVPDVHDSLWPGFQVLCTV